MLIRDILLIKIEIVYRGYCFWNNCPNTLYRIPNFTTYYLLKIVYRGYLFFGIIFQTQLHRIPNFTALNFLATTQHFS